MLLCDYQLVVPVTSIWLEAVVSLVTGSLKGPILGEGYT
jgi:hypothetical protein